MDLDLYWYKLQVFAVPHLADLRDFYFYYDNPVLWAGLVVILLILLRFWRIKKALSFCIIEAGILLASTKLGHLCREWITQAGGEFDYLLLRIGTVFLLVIVFFYYAVIARDD